MENSYNIRLQDGPKDRFMWSQEGTVPRHQQSEIPGRAALAAGGIGCVRVFLTSWQSSSKGLEMLVKAVGPRRSTVGI